MKSHDKAFLISLLSWIVLSLALTIIGVYFTTAVGIATLISIATFVFFEYEFFNKRLKLAPTSNSHSRNITNINIRNITEVVNYD